jgi:antitoxin VapB
VTATVVGSVDNERVAVASAPRPVGITHDNGPLRHYVHLVTSSSTGSRMGAQLSIKSDDAYRLASRLSELTGESPTTVVTKALRAELDRQERLRDPDALEEELWKMAGEIKANMPDDVTSDHSWLYDDETGLPK